MKPILSAISASLLVSSAFAQNTPTETSSIVLAPNAAVAIVKVLKPWYAPRSLVISKMQATVALYEQLPGLSYKIFTLTQ